MQNQMKLRWMKAKKSRLSITRNIGTIIDEEIVEEKRTSKLFFQRDWKNRQLEDWRKKGLKLPRKK